MDELRKKRSVESYIGWCKHPRGLHDDPFFIDEIFTQREAYWWLMEEAVFARMSTNVDGIPVTLERGQLSTSFIYMAKAWGWHRSKVERYINKLVKYGKIEKEVEAGRCLITICNYNKFQGDCVDSEASNEKHASHQRESSENNRKKLNKTKKEKEVEENIVGDFTEDVWKSRLRQMIPPAAFNTFFKEAVLEGGILYFLHMTAKIHCDANFMHEMRSACEVKNLITSVKINIKSS